MVEKAIHCNRISRLIVVDLKFYVNSLLTKRNEQPKPPEKFTSMTQYYQVGGQNNERQFQFNRADVLYFFGNITIRQASFGTIIGHYVVYNHLVQSAPLQRR